MICIKKFSVQLVKESNARYEIADKKISNPDMAFEIFNKVFNMDTSPVEMVCMLTLDTQNNVTGAFQVTIGSLNSSIVHPRDIFQRAILQNAKSVILGHNHPSGSTVPSDEDKQVTERLVEAGKIIGIDIIDHIIVSLDNDFTSMKAIGLI